MTSHANVLKEQGNTLLKQKRYNEAVDIYNEALRWIDEQKDSCYDNLLVVLCSNLALAYLSLNKWEDLEKITTRGIIICEENAASSSQLKQIYIKLLYRRAAGFEKQKIKLNEASTLVAKILRIDVRNMEAIKLINRINSVAEKSGTNKDSTVSKMCEYLEKTIDDLTNFKGVYKNDVQDYIDLLINIHILISNGKLSKESLLRENIIEYLNTTLQLLIKHDEYGVYANEMPSEEDSASIEKKNEKKFSEENKEEEENVEYRKNVAINITLNYRLRCGIYVLYANLLAWNKEKKTSLLFMADLMTQIYAVLNIQNIESQISSYIRKGIVDSRKLTLNDLIDAQDLYACCVQSNDTRFLRTLICLQLTKITARYYMLNKLFIENKKTIKPVFEVDLNNQFLLRTFVSILECFESSLIMKTALQMFYTITDQILSLKSNAKATKKSQYLSIIINLLCQHLVHPDTEIRTVSEATLTNVVSLLADKDRPEADRVDLSDYLHTLLQPFHENTANETEIEIALKSIALVSSIDQEVLASLLSSNEYIEKLVNYALTPYSPIQSAALDLLIYGIQCVNIRLCFLNSSDLLTKLVDAINLKTSKHELQVQIKCAIILSKLSLHDENTRALVFDLISFINVLNDIIHLYFIKNKTSSSSCSTENNNATSKTNQSSGTSQNVSSDVTKRKSVDFFDATLLKRSNKDNLQTYILELLIFLSLHKSFKKTLLSDKDIIITCIYHVGQNILTKIEDDIMPDYKALSHYSVLLANLMKHNKDKQINRKTKKVNTAVPNLEEDQLEALREMYEKLPQECKPLKNGEYDRGPEELSQKLTQKLIACQIHQTIILSALKKNLPPYIYVLLGECLWYFARVVDLRKPLAAANVLNALLNILKNLTKGASLEQIESVLEPSYEEDVILCKQALCYICITVDVSLLSSELALNVLPHLVAMMKNSYELYNYEACLAITNLTWCHDSVRSAFYYAKGVNVCVDIITSDNELCRAAGLEVLCNMAQCAEWTAALCAADARHSQSILFQLLNAFLNDQNERVQSAAAGCLAMLTVYVDITKEILSCTNSSNILNLSQVTWKHRESFQTRLVTIWFNIAQAALQVTQSPDLSKPEYQCIVNFANKIHHILTYQQTQLNQLMHQNVQKLILEYQQQLKQ